MSSSNTTKTRDIGPSFWSLKRGRADLMLDYDDEDQAEQHIKRQKLALAKSYGVGYEWVTEPPGCCESGPDWQDTDHMFVGADSSEVARVEKDLARRKKDAIDGSEGSGDEQLKVETVLNRPLDFQRIVTYPERLFRGNGLPLPSDLVGTYDLIFYAGDLEDVMRHHRTAKGTLSLSTRIGDAGEAFLVGSVEMNPSMDLLDVIPFGGNLKFGETKRVQRVTRKEWSRERTSKFKDGSIEFCPYQKVENSTKQMDATGVISLKVTEPPDGMPSYTFLGTECDCRGEMRIFRERIATGILPEHYEYSDERPSSKYRFEDTGTKAAEEVLKNHFEKTCSWLHNHTILSKSVASKVGEFLCPPPVLFFEKGDICLDLWWGGLKGFSYSQLVARRCVSSAEVPKPVVRHLTNEERHRQEIQQFEEEIQKLEVKKQLACFAFYCQDKISQRNNLEIDFEVEGYRSCQRSMINNAFDVRECVRYMDKVFFNKQLERYNLRLESHKFCVDREQWDREPWYQFKFARIRNTCNDT